MHRDVQPELLDDLSSTDPQAVGSRADLRRLNSIMGHEGMLADAFLRHHAATPVGSQPLRIVEMGAGDGTLLLRLARRWSAIGVTANITLIDRQDLVAAETHRAFAALNWPVEIVTTDILTWLAQSSPPVDVMLANLFLHHFPDPILERLLCQAAVKTSLFIACEPRRAASALLASRLLWFIGCNGITRHDAVVSVRAGFGGHELSALWPTDPKWVLSEQPTGLFSHCFIAKKYG